MSRLILILALVVAGILPGVVCRQAVAGVNPAIAAAADCGMDCCDTACCCVAEPGSSSHPSPDTPATPPRGVDVLPLTLHVSPSLYQIATPADPGRAFALLLAEARFRSRDAVEAEPRLCRWLT